LNDKYSLKRLYLDLRDRAEDQLEAIERELLHRQAESTFPKFSKILKRILADIPEADGRAVRVLQAALASQELVAYVLRPNTAEAYKIGSRAWYMAGDLHDTVETITTGAFHISDRLGRPNSADREVVNRPVFVEQNDAERFLRLRGLSEPHIRQACERAIEHIERTNPCGVGRKSQFKVLVKQFLSSLRSGQIEAA
jgi:hypothetical protein